MSRRGLPSGTVTFLFTDIEASTKLLQEHGAGYAAMLDEHRRVLRQAFEGHDGAEVDTQGDAFFVAFARAGDAVAAAAEAQGALEGGPIRVRMGLHTDEPVVTDDGYVGIDVHRAARIAAAAHGGQVVLSEATRRLLTDDLAVRDLGEPPAHAARDDRVELRPPRACEPRALGAPRSIRGKFQARGRGGGLRRRSRPPSGARRLEPLEAGWRRPLS